MHMHFKTVTMCGSLCVLKKRITAIACAGIQSARSPRTTLPHPFPTRKDLCRLFASEAQGGFSAARKLAKGYQGYNCTFAGYQPYL